MQHYFSLFLLFRNLSIESVSNFESELNNKLKEIEKLRIEISQLQNKTGNIGELHKIITEFFINSIYYKFLSRFELAEKKLLNKHAEDKELFDNDISNLKSAILDRDNKINVLKFIIFFYLMFRSLKI